MFRDSIIAAVRTGIAALVGLFLAWLATNGFEVSDELSQNLDVALFGLFTALYNGLVIILERKVNPLFGVLLGIPKAPSYGDVGTQTSPPADPAIGDARVDNGNTSLAFVGLALVVAGILILVLTTASTLGYIALVIGVVALIASAFMRSRAGV